VTAPVTRAEVLARALAIRERNASSTPPEETFASRASFLK
jgi:hypothetical protein